MNISSEEYTIKFKSTELSAIEDMLNDIEELLTKVRKGGFGFLRDIIKFKNEWISL